MTTQKRNHYIFYLIGTVFLLWADQFTKHLAVSYLKNENSVILIQNVFQLHYLENRGAAFGLLQGQKVWFVLSTSLMLILMVLVYLRIPSEKRYRWMRFTITLLTAGALGNLIDRLRLNYVIDFFYFELINFPIFNVADIYVTVGMALLLITILFYYRDEELEILWPFRKKRCNLLWMKQFKTFPYYLNMQENAWTNFYRQPMRTILAPLFKN